MKKRIISALLSVVLLFSVMPMGVVTVFAEPSAVATSGTVGDLTWSVTSNRLIISGNGAMLDYYYESPPWYGFRNTVKTIVVNEGITYIGNSAFSGFAQVTAVSLPKTLTVIGASAFYYCSKIKAIALPENLNTIAYRAFCNCAELQSVTLPAKLETIGDSAFYKCPVLEIADIPESVTSIGSYAFKDTKTMTDFEAGSDDVLYIGSWAIYGKRDVFDELIIKSTTKHIANSAFSFCNYSAVNIPNGVTNLPDSVFYNNTALQSVTIPATVKTIGESCFDNCTKLEHLTLPDGLTKIGAYAFDDTPYYANEANWQDGALYSGNYLLTAKKAKGGFKVKAGTKVIADKAFWSSDALTSLTLPEGLITIGDYAFYNYENVFTSLTIPESVTYIGEYAFCDTPLKQVNIPKNVEYIGSRAFFEDNLSCEITIPKSTTYIGDAAFTNNPNLTKITVAKDNTVFKMAGGCLINNNTKTLITGIGNAVIPTDGSVQIIANGAFYNNTKITALNLPKSVSKIENEAFYACSNIKTITAESGNKNYTAVNNCLISADGNLTVVCANSVLPESGITKMVDGTVFYKINGLKSIHIPAGVSIKYSCYLATCPDLESITVDPSNTQFVAKNNCLIENNKIVAGCKNSVIPVSLTVNEIEGYAFDGCVNLKTLHIPATITDIGYNAFRGCDKLEK